MLHFQEAELLEPLMPAIRACLEHRHSYVRRNAVFAIYTIYRYAFFILKYEEKNYVFNVLVSLNYPYMGFTKAYVILF